MRDDIQSDECAQYLKALADPERLKIIQCLRDGPMPVGRLAAAVGASVATTSHHLLLLNRAGLVSREKRGRFVFYEVAPKLRGRTPRDRKLNVLEFGCCRIDLKPSER